VIFAPAICWCNKKGIDVLIPPAPPGSNYTLENSSEICRQFAIASLANVIKKVSDSHEQPLRYRNIRKDAHLLLLDILGHKGVWTTEWAEELENIINAARKSGILLGANMKNPVSIHPALGFLTNIYDEVYRQIKSDPDVDCLRVRNLIDDVIDLDSDLLIWSLNNDTDNMPQQLSDRYVDVLATAKRLDLLPYGFEKNLTTAKGQK
jgi:hypothetical protein